MQVGPVKETLEALRGQEGSAARPLQSLAVGEGGLTSTTSSAIGTSTAARKLSIGVVGFGKFGQFIAKTFAKHHSVRAMGRSDTSAAAKALGCRCVLRYFH
jgi:arogenate dehydrogenase (NADP+), plant